MSKVRVQSFAVSIDGYGAGPNQDLPNPIGVGGTELMEWFFPTRARRRMHGHDDGETGADNEVAERGFAGNRRLDPRAEHVRARARTVA